MGLSKSTRIQILLAIDSAFFLLELVVGYAVHSLALVADSFHMLNDVISLLVGLWAVKVANQKTSSNMYTYGWQRAETLGALINGVFLVALCLSIFLEAIQRFVEPQEVGHPQLVLIVGCFGLLSNFIGLFLFHDHGHSHGDESGHTHGSKDTLSAAEEGHGHEYADVERRSVADERGSVANVLPQARIGNWPTSQTETQPRNAKQNEISWDMEEPGTPKSIPKRRNSRRHSRSMSRGYQTLDDIYVHPASFRREIITAGMINNSESSTDNEIEVGAETSDEAGEGTTLLRKRQNPPSPSKPDRHTKHAVLDGSGQSHKGHKHNQPSKGAKSGGHSHGDLNMRGMFLHVMGDALGNIGVIASALFIWLTDFWWRFYSDPLISLIITVIILLSAIPLCKAASRILLQAVPYGLSVEDIQEDIEKLDGIVSCHHLHVWQLSDTKFVASLHVEVEFDFKGEGSARYMALARAIRKCLHEYGIHSSTIQPEFCLDASHTEPIGTDDDDDGVPRPRGVPKKGSRTASLRSEQNACLLECGDECDNGKQCCPAKSNGSDK